MSTQEQRERFEAEMLKKLPQRTLLTCADGTYREPVMRLALEAFCAAEASAIERCANLIDETWFKSQADCAAAIRALLKGDGGAHEQR